MRILIIGGYGAFGGRLARLLAHNSKLTLFIGGRNYAKAEAFCAQLSGSAAGFIPIKLDKFDLGPVLNRYKPDIVVDASGPFNLKRDNSYAVIKACLKAGVHYLDLADGAEFVMRVPQFNQAAKRKNLTIISGLSTCPALTGAVLKEAQKDMQVQSIEIGVAPSPFARMGLSVVQGIFDYAGSNITRYENGVSKPVKALTNTRRQTIAPPGAMPLRNRLFAFVDAPDLQVFAENNPSIKDSWVGAGTKPEYLLRCLVAFSKFRALLRLPKFSFLAKPAHGLLNGLSHGEHRGGLYVKLRGPKMQKSWHIIAEGEDGPFIPSMACAALITKWAAGDTPATGARIADKEVELDNFKTFFATRDIRYGWRIANKQSYHEFEHILCSTFNNLPKTVRALHSPTKPQVWCGQAEVQGPSNLLGKLAGLIAGIRVKSGNLPVTVTITPGKNGELWERNFDGQKFKSRLKAGTGKNQHLMMETFGALSFAMALTIKGDRLYFTPRRWFFLGIPMPQFLLPGGETYETEQDGKFIFHVTLNVPIIGRIASYKGWLTQQGT